jgi:hypothetical protein
VDKVVVVEANDEVNDEVKEDVADDVEDNVDVVAVAIDVAMSVWGTCPSRGSAWASKGTLGGCTEAGISLIVS